MRKRKRYTKTFFKTLFYIQNKYHKHGVILHTLRVAYGTLKFKQYRMFTAALLHDFGKPFVAYQDESDLKQYFESYSFTNHEEASYQIIKKWTFISDYTKNLVRYHYIIRDMKKSKQKGKFARYNRLHKIWVKLPEEFKKDLEIFIKIDDYGKG